MKKLIYIFLLGFVFVACDKNDDNLDLQVLTPVEKEIVSISNDFDISSIDVDGLINRLTTSTAKNNKKTGSEASKAPGVAGESYISLYTGIINGNLFEIAFDDTQEFCAPTSSGLDYITLFYATNGDSQIKLGDETGIILATIEADLSFLYGLDIIQGVKINAATKSVAMAALVDNVFTF